MKNRKMLAMVCCAVMAFLAAFGAGTQMKALAEAKTTLADIKADATLEDYAGEYTCVCLFMQDNLIPATPETMQEAEIPTLKIENDEATFTGFAEMGTDPVKLTFEDGMLYFEPEKDDRVFTLQLLEDGMVTMKFNQIEMAPVFCFMPAADSAK